ncbi:MAG: protein-glutamate O-methyltransferase CheR [Chitinispirillaceae bacterium]|nr:protein-glutamate O-methyltransferase CheR [Chitinispirillaceae bacterium]
MDISDREFDLLKEYVLRESGIDIAEEKRYLFTTRLSDLLVGEGIMTFFDFYSVLVSGTRSYLVDQLLALMTTHESGFFRDRHPYRVFTDTVLPETAKRRAERARFLPPRLRILSAGCSFGQEPYSIALCVKRWLPTQSVFSEKDITIIGTDISALTIKRAKRGEFSDLELGKQLSSRERQDYFSRNGETWQLCEEIRNMVTFQQVNLLKPFDNLGKFDVVFCRNVIIYFSIEGRKTVVGHLRRVLEPEGTLFLGSAESLYTISNDFTSRAVEQTTYYTPS